MKNIVLVGAGWTGMSGVAGMLHDLWYTNIICIDASQSQLTDNLKEKWLQVIIGHGKYKIQFWDAIIYSEATAESEEVLEARNLRKDKRKVMVILNYFQFLGEISKYFSTTWFTGTNGKSSSTALAIHTAKKILPNFWLGILGALVPSFDNKSYVINTKAKKDIQNIFDYIFTGKWLNYTIIKKRNFFVEACEYKRHFLYLDLDYTIITSLELDHTDYYKDMKDYLSAFDQLINKTKQKVFVPKWLKKNTTAKIQEIVIKKITFDHLIGEHNNINGSLVLELLKTLSKETKTKITSSLKTFWWIRRRMEYLTTTTNGAKIFTDYGHMASSIDFGYEALKQNFPDKKLCVIFQPHQINRIITWRKDFQNALKKYDQSIVYDIYAARENLSELVKKIPALKNIKTLKQLGDNFAKACWGIYTDKFEDITKEIEQAKNDSVIIVYSAGDVDYKLRSFLKI